MRLFALIVAAMTVVPGVFAVDVQKSVVISYPNDTPNWVVDKAIQAIEDSNGVIIHKYDIIKGFAARLGEKVLGTVSEWGKQYNAVVEEDETISAI